MDADGNPIPAGPEFLQKYVEAVAQGKGKPTPTGGVGVTASMIVLDPEDEAGTSVSCAAVRVSEDYYYAMIDSGTKSIGQACAFACAVHSGNCVALSWNPDSQIGKGAESESAWGLSQPS